MQAIIFIGIQATGKSTFYKTHFFNSHIRISLDLLNTRNKESRFLETCMATHSKFVVDNTNPTRLDREKYIAMARANNYTITGYYFSSSINEALERNAQRTGKEKVPDAGIRGGYAKLEIPQMDEGFDELYFVKTTESGFTVESWKNEV